MLIAVLCGTPDILYRLGRLGCCLGLRLAGIRIQTEGLEFIAFGQNYLFLANHQSYCDPPALIARVPRNVRLVLKKELRRIPLLGAIMSLGGFIFIDRRQGTKALKQMLAGAHQIRQGHSFLIYPEGTRTRTGRLEDFKEGPFALAIESGVPIIPVTVSGSFAIMPPLQLRLKPGTIKLTFHRPITTTGLRQSNRHSLINQVRQAIILSLQDSEKPIAQKDTTTTDLEAN